ncbi:MAG: Uma2 family endonuclease [Planctomycetales bacterium]
MTTLAMQPPPSAPPQATTVGDLLERLGGISPERIRLHPAPGTATERDLEFPSDGQKLLVELIDGTLVEKTMGYFESRLAFVIGYFLESFLNDHDLGIFLGADATLRYQPGLVRLPDGSFFSWNRFPNRELPSGAFIDFAPDLAIEVLSRGNTRREMARKREECFAAGTKLIWEVDPRARTVAVYSAPEACLVVDENGVLDGGEVLPGFSLPVRQWFEQAARKKAD